MSNLCEGIVDIEEHNFKKKDGLVLKSMLEKELCEGKGRRRRETKR